MRCKRCGASTFGTPRRDASGMFYICGRCKNRMDYNPQPTIKEFGLSRCPRCGTAISVGWMRSMSDISPFHSYLTCPVCQLPIYD